MRVGSLFTGIGGFDLGFERAGMEIVWQCENDPYCQTVLRRHWPEARMYDDVREVGADTPAVDVVCGGFPCQDVSVAGRRAGLAGERSGLWHEFARVLSELRPEWCVIENVPGLLSSNRGRDFATVIQGLVQLGYGVCWRVLDSQYHGVAQRRRRVFVVGHLGDGRAAEVLFEREGVCGHPPARGKAREDATPILEAGARTGSGTPLVAACLVERDAKGADSDTKPGHLITTQAVAFDWQSGGDNRLSASVECSTTLQANQTQAVAFDTTQVTSPGNYSQPDVAQVQWASGGGQLENPTAQALRSSAEHSYQFCRIASSVRRLTPVECERLQAFPDGWTGGQADSPRYRQLGNAVTVNVAEWIGRRIMEVDR